jgi:arsenate reductase
VITLYGIANCDKCRAARKWFGAADVPHAFHDVRKDGLTAELVRGWLTHVSADELLNKRGRTWREIPASKRDNLSHGDLVELVLAHPTITKRPLVATGSEILVGYDEQRWQAIEQH